MSQARSQRRAIVKRLFALHALLLAGPKGGVHYADLARKLKDVPRTVYRDLTTMRETGMGVCPSGNHAKDGRVDGKWVVKGGKA